ncbi:hypothetical protein HDV57DRAFT_510634 [Trichoderma longibrachiatum]|uniref:Uncharacterized protein n=1 Tax=Trichoderma longibrachiatum ATCC 18648 TaxID=983965 RepID=A0A2T4C0Y4_TRILO|nr:hypothetical protein M440DRAFT_1439797 [Trichoderma longibrachiatum ATCC 18648]
MADTGPPRRRFVPVPIETTFQSYRKNVYDYTSHQRIGPNPELTPEPSPRSPEAQFPPEMHDRETSQERRRFAPQLIETSRRVRRVGDPGPATRPTDKTDITPYTNHIYSAKPKASRRQLGPAGDDEPQRNVSRPFPPTRRETEEEGVQEYLLDLAAKQVARQIEEVALAAFPNSRPREGGVAHFYFRESSTDSGSSPEASPRDEEAGQYRFRRKSSNLGLNWWHKHMQEHAARLEQDRGDGMDVDNEEAVVMQDDLDAAAAAAAAAAGGAASAASAASPLAIAGPGPGPSAAADSPLIRSDSDLDKMELPSPPDLLWTTTKPMLATDSRRSSVAELQLALAEANRAAAQAQAKLAASSVPADPSAQPADPHPGRQEPGPFGRPFGGFRHVPDADPKLLKLRQGPSPPMLGKDLVFRRCPSPKFTTLEPEDSFEAHMIEDGGRDVPGQAGLWRGYCCRSESTGGCIRLQREKAQAERDEKILQEFGEDFVTQVYNYLSLGYPAMARGFDEELSRISHIDIDELRRDDEKQMAKGHMVEMKLDVNAPEEERCPRWAALRAYITEWARQHPDLDNLDPLAWGVRERRGSWAI